MLKRLLAAMFLFSVIHLPAQDPHYSDYSSARMYLNPGMAGSDSTLVLSAGGRIQWPNLSGKYITGRFSADNYFRCLHGGLGIDVMHDEAGSALKTSTVSLSYAPHFELFQHRLAVQPGISLGYFSKSIDWSKLTFGDMIDERRGFTYNTGEVPGRTTVSGIDLHAGIFMYSRMIYGGFAVHHLTEPDEGFISKSRLPAKLTGHAGMNIRPGKGDFILSPNILVMYQKDFHQYLPGFSFAYKWLTAGVSCRIKDALIAKAGFQNRFMKIGYAYDLNISFWGSPTGGAHELQLSFFLNVRGSDRRLSVRMI